jgi:hypothetical protein
MWKAIIELATMSIALAIFHVRCEVFLIARMLRLSPALDEQSRAPHFCIYAILVLSLEYTNVMPRIENSDNF